MKVLLLGANGQLGSDVRRAHAEAGEPFELVPLARRELDAASPDAVGRVLGSMHFDVLVNCIAHHKVDEIEDAAAPAFAVNAHAVDAMARVCADRQARFVHVSTDYVFGGAAAPGRPLREDDPTAPVNVYGSSKALGETLAHLACEEVVILRVASLFGVAGVGGKGGNFVETVIRMGREKGALRVVDDQTMSPTAAADAARIILQLAKEGCAPGVYHVVNEGQTTWFEFAAEILRSAGIKARVTSCSSAEYPTRARRPRYSALDNAKARATFDPMPPWREALDRYLRAREHVGGATG